LVHAGHVGLELARGEVEVLAVDDRVSIDGSELGRAFANVAGKFRLGDGGVCAWGVGVGVGGEVHSGVY
jgi:hypothetical protein